MRTLIALLFAVFTLPALAQTSGVDPYEGRASVADQSNASRDRGLRDALATVIERVSGAGASARPEAAGVLGRASQMVQRYGFATVDGNLQLAASFDKNAVDGQLRAAGLPVWGFTAAPAVNTDLTVTGVRGSADYSKVLTALRAVPGVRKVAVLGAEADQLSLTVDAEGGAARLVGALGNGPQFVRDPSAAAGSLSLRLVR